MVNLLELRLVLLLYQHMENLQYQDVCFGYLLRVFRRV